jgi:hypothetical protein
MVAGADTCGATQLPTTCLTLIKDKEQYQLGRNLFVLGFSIPVMKDKSIDVVRYSLALSI